MPIDFSGTWKNSRSGAWASRGFYYQHLLTVFLLLRQWAGLDPAGRLVPEGLDDCVVELPDCDLWIQIKSRKDGNFRKTEVDAILGKMGASAAQIPSQRQTHLAVVLERPCSDVPEQGVERLYEASSHPIFICGAPGDAAKRLLIQRFSIADAIAKGIVSDLYRLVAETSAMNASLSFVQRRRITTTETERRIFEYLEAHDPSAINAALRSGAIEPVDFISPINEPGFYQGVKVQPGHIAAGLVLSRGDETAALAQTLKKRRSALIVGPSGAGKSALLWLTANSLASETRWFRITIRATLANVDDIVRYIRALQPSKRSCIGLAFDEVSASNSEVWNELARGLSPTPEVFLLGSIRQEDVNLVEGQSETEIVRIGLSERLAEDFWKELAQRRQTTWPHWREPFEQSEGLMLEYTHLLTQGKRLEAVIGDQIRQRERENRQDELRIIRGVSAISAYGGEVQADKLLEALELTPSHASKALRRLLDEHVVRESRPGVLGGLHRLRSQALYSASHDEVFFLRAQSLWRSLVAVTPETLPGVILAVFENARADEDDVALQRLADALAANDDLAFWAAVFTGLGMATLERAVRSFLAILEKHGVPRAHWSFASMYYDPNIDVSRDSFEYESWRLIYDAIAEFRSLKLYDLRATCLQKMPGAQPPDCKDIRLANQLLSSLSPIHGCEPIQLAPTVDVSEKEEHSIHDIAALLSTAHYVKPELAEKLVADFGGEDALFAVFHAQTPWATYPTVKQDESLGRTVCADLYLVSEAYRKDIHESIVDMCWMLLAISPTSDAVASAAVGPSGQPIKAGDYHLCLKTILRKNLPTKTRVAWNVTLRKILLSKAGTLTLTQYAFTMAAIIVRVEKVFRIFSEKWIKGKNVPSKATMADEINVLLEQVNSIAHVYPSRSKSNDSVRHINQEPEEGTLGQLVTFILGNIIPRMGIVLPNGGLKALACFAASTAVSAREEASSSVWRVAASPPKQELLLLAQRLEDIASILHELDHDSSPQTIKALQAAAKKGSKNKLIPSAARWCRANASWGDDEQ
jgi:DNA-binding transcriptional ArsR family regulator